MQIDTNKNMISIADAAKVSEVSTRTIRTYMEKKILKNSVHTEDGWRIDFDELATVIQQRGPVIKRFQDMRRDVIAKKHAANGVKAKATATATKTTENDDRYIRLSTAAKKYNILIGTLWHLVRRHVPNHKVGRDRYVDAAKLSAFIAEREHFRDNTDYVLQNEAIDLVAERMSCEYHKARDSFVAAKLRPAGQVGNRVYWDRKKVLELAEVLRKPVVSRETARNKKAAKSTLVVEAKTPKTAKPPVTPVPKQPARFTPAGQTYGFEFDGMAEVMDVMGAIFRSKMANGRYTLTADDVPMLEALAKGFDSDLFALFIGALGSGKRVKIFTNVEG